MCGISFVHKKDGRTAKKAIIKRYEAQKSRGTEGFGYLAIKQNKLVSHKRSELESTIKQLLEKETANTILFHHRYPTSTPNFKESAHPIKVSNIDLKYDYYLVHNGIIHNADDLKEKHEKLGFYYNTEITKKFVTTGTVYTESMFNDSEALAVEVALAIDKGTMTIEARGSIAFIVAQVQKTTNRVVSVFFARNEGSPLKLCVNNDLISIGSESEGVNISPKNEISKLDLKSCEITKHDFIIPSYYYPTYPTHTTYGGGYDDDDLDELYERSQKNRQIGFSSVSKSDTTFGNQDDDQSDLYDDWYNVENDIDEMGTLIKNLKNMDDGSDAMAQRISEAEEELINLYTERTGIEMKLGISINKRESEEAEEEAEMETIPFDDFKESSSKVKKIVKKKSKTK